MSSKPTPSRCTRLIPKCLIPKSRPILASPVARSSRGCSKRGRKLARCPRARLIGPRHPRRSLLALRVENDSLRADKRSLRSDVERLEEERAILRKATKCQAPGFIEAPFLGFLSSRGFCRGL